MDSADLLKASNFVTAKTVKYRKQDTNSFFPVQKPSEQATTCQHTVHRKGAHTAAQAHRLVLSPRSEKMRMDQVRLSGRWGGEPGLPATEQNQKAFKDTQ